MKNKFIINVKLYKIVALILVFIVATIKLSNSSPEEKKHLSYDFENYSSLMPDKKLNIIFIHHSCGAALLAENGSKSGKYCLYTSHPNGGGLRSLLQKNNYVVHEATYGSKIGQDTDIGDWQYKFRNHMEEILRIKEQDVLLDNGEKNQIVMFKSCYPNNNFIGYGRSPGDFDSSVRTLWNAKAAYNSLLPIFQKYPETLFIAVTAPPLVDPKTLGNEASLPGISDDKISSGYLARQFNNWLVDRNNGWLLNYPLKNIVVFDYYDILTKDGLSDWAEYPTANSKNSHPSSVGNNMAARRFMPFINRAVRFSGIYTDGKK